MPQRRQLPLDRVERLDEHVVLMHINRLLFYEIEFKNENGP